MKFMRLAAAALLTFSLAAGCGSDDADTPAAGGEGNGAEVTVTGQWARTSPAGAENGAVYMTLRSEEGDSLTGASVGTSVAAKAEIHETMASMASTTAGGGTSMGGSATTAAGGGMMSMKPVEEIELPKGTDVALEPGGYHVMLLDLAKPLAAGDKLTVTLTFAKAGTQEVEVPVRDSAP